VLNCLLFYFGRFSVSLREKNMQKAQWPCQKINSQIINVAFLSIDFLKIRIHDF